MVRRETDMKNLFVQFAVILVLVCASSPHLIAQVSGQQVLEQQFEQYRRSGIQEKVFLHSDKEFYMAGEICWFKVYTVDAAFHKPLGISKVGYIEILDTDHKPAIQSKIFLKDGFGNGSLQLPATLGSGNYTIRAYTNWMKNVGVDYFFEKTITIVNPRKVLPETKAVPGSQYETSFFPEGGNLVTGLQSKIAFKVTDRFGKGVACNGFILGTAADTLARFSTLKFGIGSFLFTPQSEKPYTAVIILPDGKRIEKELPAAFTSGLVMRLEEAGTGRLRITVRSSAAGLSTKGVYIFAHTRNANKLVMHESLSNGQAIFMIDKSRIGEGISHFTIFTDDRKPVCERLYFKYPRQEFSTTVMAEKVGYGLRNKVNLHLQTNDMNSLPVTANMSMAVYRVDSLQDASGVDINTYLWLNADLAGTIESPEYYFSGNGTGLEAATDNLMLSHGWRRFRWEDVLGNKAGSFEFIPEYAGHIVTAKITDSRSGLPAKDINCYISVTGTQKQFRSSVSDEQGLVRFDLGEFYNDGEVVIQTNFRQDSMYTVEIQKPFSVFYSGKRLPPFPTTITAGQLSMHYEGLQVRNAFNGNSLKQIYPTGIDTMPFYYKPDVSYLLDNFVRFTTMEEVLREYVAEVNVRKRNNEFVLYVFNKQRNFTFETEPLVLLDGVPVFDMNKLMQYDPLKVRRLDVITQSYQLGSQPHTGIVNFITYTGNLDGYELDPHATVVDYEGLQLQREFYAPRYETPEQLSGRIPDYRTLLYWNPTVTTNARGQQDLSFYSSDLPGRYVVVVQGITENGKAGHKAIYFDVR